MIEVPLTTNRLVIRQFEPDDLPAYLDFMLDETSTRYLSFEPEQKTEAGATALFEHVLANYGTAQAVHAYAIADRMTGTYLGSCGFAPYDEGICECYYCINAAHRGKGYATETLTALLKALPDDHEIRAYCHPQNTAAHRVATRAGMTCQGSATHRISGLTGEMFSYDVA